MDAYKYFINSKDVLDLLYLKLLFLGPPGMGKTTTRRRAVKEIVDLLSAYEEEQVHRSTGDGAMPTTGAYWSLLQSLSEEACLLFHVLKDAFEKRTISHSVPDLHDKNVRVSQVTDRVPSHTFEQASQPGLLQNVVTGRHSTPQQATPFLPKNAASTVQSNEKFANEHMKSQDFSEIAAIFKEVAKLPQFMESIAKPALRAFLRIQDSGGQPELMDMLPALTIGPGLYLLFFSYEFGLDQEYRVFYQRASGRTTAPENSEFTLQEMLLRTLASISCFSSSTHHQPLSGSDHSAIGEILESSKSVVYLVGTHKDKVSEEYIASVDSQLQKVIRDTDFYKNGIVQFCSEDKLVVSLDNMGGGVEEINHLHQLLESAMEKHFRRLKIPAVWLLFSLCLRMREVRTASLETCLALSHAFNMTPYETTVALWFLHYYAGVLMYFPSVPGLEDLVIIDIQVVYDSITGVIFKTMSVGEAKAKRFRETGRFTMKDLKTATDDISGDVIPPEQLVALLAYLHIIAEIVSVEYSKSVLEEEKEYIIPCVLENTSAKELDLFHKESSRSCLVEPLLMYFSSGFTPMGLFSASMACLISNKSFTFIRVGVKKNMVTFLYGSILIRVTFISRSKYFEVVVSCDPTFQDSIHHECTALKQEIEDTLNKASSRMNYNSYMDYQFAFDCRSHEGGNHFGVVDGVHSVPKVMKCLFNPDSPQAVVLTNRHLIWYGQVCRNRLCILTCIY